MSLHGPNGNCARRPALCVLTAVILAGCGASAHTRTSASASGTVTSSTMSSVASHTVSTPGFAVALNQLCQQSRRALLTAFQTGQARVLDGPTAAKITGPYVQRIALLSPPSGLTAAFHRYVALIEQQAADDRSANINAAATLAPERDALARRLGASACIKG